MKFGLNKFGILMMESNFREFVARLVSAEFRAVLCVERGLVLIKCCGSVKI